MEADPNTYTKQTRGDRGPRDRDVRRRDGKVRSPMFFNGLCVICWSKGKTRRTNRYCLECALDPTWSYKIRSDGYTFKYHPRLCSRECWDVFHTSRVSGLDFQQRKKARGSRQPPPAAAAAVSTTPEV